MAITDLNQLCSQFAAAVNAGDLDAVCDFYAPDAVFAGPQGPPAAGGAAIREVLAGFLSSRPVMEFERVYLHQCGEIALARGRWKLTSTGPDGAPSVVTGGSVEVLRRQADGSWRYIIDTPWGAD